MAEDQSIYEYLCARPYKKESTISDGLIFLLETRSWAETALRRCLASGIQGLIPHDCRCQSQYRFEDGSRPDIALFTRDNKLAALIEVKIDAVLTPKQPKEYLKRMIELRQNQQMDEGLMLFLVPSVRRIEIWQEVRARLSEFQCDLLDKRSIRVKGIVIAILEWGELISSLENSSTNDNPAKEVIATMKRTTDNLIHLDISRINSAWVGDSGLATEIFHYMQIAGKINEKLKNCEEDPLSMLKTFEDRSATGFAWTGKYYSVYGCKWFWIGFSPENWSLYQISPIWISIDTDGGPEIEQLRPKFEDMLTAKTAFFLKADGKDSLRIPIELKTDTSGDELVGFALEQISAVVERIRR